VAKTPAKTSTIRAGRIRGRAGGEILTDLQNTWHRALETAAGTEGLKGRAATTFKTQMNKLITEYSSFTDSLTRQLQRRTKQLSDALGGTALPGMATAAPKGRAQAKAGGTKAATTASRGGTAKAGTAARGKATTAKATGKPGSAKASSSRSAAASKASRSQAPQEKAKAGRAGGAARASNRNPTGPRATTGGRSKRSTAPAPSQEAMSQAASPPATASEMQP
jgi:hypothetical protein